MMHTTCTTVVIFIHCTLQCFASCTFPKDLNGDFYSSSRGVLTFNESSVSNFRLNQMGPQTFHCEWKGSGNRYIAKSTIQIFSGVFGDFYLCMNFNRISSAVFNFTLDSVVENTIGERIKVDIGGQFLLTEVTICDYSWPNEIGTQELLINTANVSQGAVQCPSTLSGQHIHVTSGECSGAMMSTGLTLRVNQDKCQALYSESGLLQCVYTQEASTNVYVVALNLDNITNDETEFRFICIVYHRRVNVKYATVVPQICQTEQTPWSYTGSGYQAILLSREPSFNNVSQTVAGIFLAVVAFFVLTLGTMSFILNFFKRKRVQPRDFGVKTKWKRVREAFENKEYPFDSIGFILEKKKNDRWTLMRREIKRFAKKKERDSLTSRERRLLYDSERRASVALEKQKFEHEDKIDAKYLQETNAIQDVPIIHEELIDDAAQRNTKYKGVTTIEIEDQITDPIQRRTSSSIFRANLRATTSMDKRKIVQWIDKQKEELRAEVIRPVPKWQQNWERYKDPFDRNRKSLPSSAMSRCSQTSIYSIRNIASPVELPDIPWSKPDSEEKTRIRKIWIRLTKLLPWIFKNRADQYT